MKSPEYVRNQPHIATAIGNPTFFLVKYPKSPVTVN